MGSDSARELLEKGLSRRLRGAPERRLHAIEVKRWFDVDFFDPNLPSSVGPTKLRSFAVFDTPDAAARDLWSFLSRLMIEQGVFAPSPDDPD